MSSEAARESGIVSALPPEHVDMALNHGTYCSERCADVLARHASRTGLRTYPPADNRDLREAIAAHAGVDAAHVLVGNGSGPLLKTCIPFVIEQQIRRSPMRMARHVLGRAAYPIVTPELTYSKVPAAALRLGLRCELLPLVPEREFALDLGDLAARLSRRDGLVYLCNPNNPTGNVLITRAQLEPLLARFSDSVFWIDEAYVHYVPDDPGCYLTDLVSRYRNLVVTRSFSFAYGLAAARVGYVVADAARVAAMEARFTPHLVGTLASALAVASLSDPSHLPYVRRTNAAQRARVLAALRGHPELQAFDSETNFVLCRVRGTWTGTTLGDALKSRGIAVKTFEPLGERRFDDYFRVTIGLPEENTRLIEQLAVLLGSRRASTAA